MTKELFESFKGLKVRYGLSQRKDGFMNVGTADDNKRDAVALLNRQRFFEREKIRGKIFMPYLMHGKDVCLVDDKNCDEMLRADGFLTNTEGIVLTITVADCFPLYFIDPSKRAVGLAHAGWRGIAKNILEEMVCAFTRYFKSKKRDLYLGIGPGIQKCHFEVHDDVFEKFKNYEELAVRKGEGYFLDLRGILLSQAKTVGIERCEASRDCTYCLKRRYFSYRRDKPKVPEVMVAYIALN